MDKKELPAIIGRMLNVPENKHDFCFYVFLKELAFTLKNNQALKIPELGVFQLKKEPPMRGEGSSALHSEQILFVPFLKPGTSGDKSLYLTFEVPDSKPQSLDFNEGVFSPSVEKPIIPIGEDLKKEATQDTGSPIENKISELIKNSEILDDFEIWKEYSTVFEEVNDEDINAELSEDDIKKKGIFDEEDEIEKEPVKTKEEESVDWGWGKELEKELDSEAVEENESGDQTNELEIDEEKLKKKMSELSGEDTDVNLVEDTPQEQKKEKNVEEVEEMLEEEDPFKALEETMIDDSEEPVSDEEIEKLVEKNGISAITDTKLNDDVPESQTDKNNTDDNDVNRKTGFFTKYKLYLLGAGILIILYWLFSPGGGEPIKEHIAKDSNIVEEKSQTKEVVASFEDVDKVEEKTSDKSKTEKKISATKEEKKNTHKVENRMPQRQTLKKSSGYYREIENDRSVGGNVFYDGNEYMLQVSSWRNSVIAEKEAEKLRKKGLDAFVVKAYVKKFKATFYRVRIGGFVTKQEALRFKRKNL